MTTKWKVERQNILSGQHRTKETDFLKYTGPQQEFVFILQLHQLQNIFLRMFSCNVKHHFDFVPFFFHKLSEALNVLKSLALIKLQDNPKSLVWVIEHHLRLHLAVGYQKFIQIVIIFEQDRSNLPLKLRTKTFKVIFKIIYVLLFYPWL